MNLTCVCVQWWLTKQLWSGNHHWQALWWQQQGGVACEVEGMWTVWSHVGVTQQHPLPKYVVCEARWRDGQQTPQPNHQSKVIATLNGTKLAHSTCLMIGANEWCIPSQSHTRLSLERWRWRRRHSEKMTVVEEAWWTGLCGMEKGIVLLVNGKV